MSITKALIAQSGREIASIGIDKIFQNEAVKGCRPELSSFPVALEPPFMPLWRTSGSDIIEPQNYYIREDAPPPEAQIRFQVWVSSQYDFDWNKSELFLKQLQTAAYRIGFEISGNSNGITVSFLCHSEDQPRIQTAFEGGFDGCEITAKTKCLLSDIPAEICHDIKFRDFFPAPPYFRLLTRPSELQSSPFRSLFAALASIKPPSIGFYQTMFQPVRHNWHRNVEILIDYEYVLKLQTGFQAQRYAQQAPSGDLKHMAVESETKAHNDKPFYAVSSRIGIIGAGDQAESSLISLSTFMSLFQHGGRPLNYLTEAIYLKVLSREKLREMIVQGLTYRHSFLANSWELTGLVHIPLLDICGYRKIPWEGIESLPIPQASLSIGTPLGVYKYAGREYPICIPDELRSSFVHSIGKSGMGKSTLIARMILHDTAMGHGVAVIDPHGDLIEVILQLLREEQIEKTIYFAPGYPDHVLIWNVLTTVPGQDISRTAEDFVAAWKNVVTGWGDRLEHLLKFGTLGLLQLPNSTMLDLFNLFRPKSDESECLRKEILKVVNNQAEFEFWKNDFGNYSKEALDPPKHKLSKLIVSGHLALTFSQPDNLINFRNIMDKGMILLADLSRVGSDTRRILGSFLQSLLRLTALTRSDIPDGDRKRFYIYIDEAHRFTTSDMEDAIVELRKFGVSALYAHQFMSQFGTKQIDALSSVGTTIIMNVDTKDARSLTKDLRGLVEYEDIISLERGEAIARIGNDIVKVELKGRIEIPEKHFREEIIQHSLAKYYRPAHEVQKWLRQRRRGDSKSFTSLVSGSVSNGEIKEFEYDEF